LSTTVVSSLFKKTFGSKLDATVLENGTHLRKDLKFYLIHIFKKCHLCEAILNLLDFIFAFLVLGIWNDFFKFVEWNHSNGLNVEEIMNN
jgi:hypothetical protein